MAQPPAYNRTKDFGANYPDQTDNQAINNELDAIAASINGTRTNLAKIQRDDGGLANGIVTEESLSEALKTDLYDEFSGNISDSVLAAQQAAVEATNAAAAAGDSAVASVAAAGQAGAAATAAQASASAASASQSGAFASSQSAASSATTATGAATAAGNSATTASGAATAATSAAGTATAQANAALASATNAQGSASAAAGSATAAAGSAAAAGASRDAAQMARDQAMAAASHLESNQGLPLFFVGWAGSADQMPAGAVEASGVLLSRAVYADVWAWLVAHPEMVVTDAQWLASPALRPVRYSSGDGTTTFRVIDLNGVQANSLQDVFPGGSAGAARGLYQADAIQPFVPGVQYETTAGMTRPVAVNRRFPNSTGNMSGFGVTDNNASNQGADGQYQNIIPVEFTPWGGTGYGTPRLNAWTRPRKANGVYWIKLANAVHNGGSVDVLALATQVNQNATRIQTLETQAPRGWTAETLWTGSLGAIAAVNLSRPLVSGLDHIVLCHASQGSNTLLYQSAPVPFDTALWPISSGNQYYYSLYCGGGITTAISVNPSNLGQVWGENFTSGYPIRAIKAFRYNQR